SAVFQPRSNPRPVVSCDGVGCEATFCIPSPPSRIKAKATHSTLEDVSIDECHHAKVIPAKECQLHFVFRFDLREGVKRPARSRCIPLKSQQLPRRNLVYLNLHPTASVLDPLELEENHFLGSDFDVVPQRRLFELGWSD